MTDAVRDSYDAKAKQYAAFVLDDLDRVPSDREWLGAFARLASPGAGVVADVGCGPGHIVNHLAELGVKAIGYDISPAMIDEAQRAFPGLQFHVGDLTSLDIADCPYGCLRTAFPAGLDVTATYRTQKGASSFLRSAGGFGREAPPGSEASRRDGATLRRTATDPAGHLACPHLTQLDRLQHRAWIGSVPISCPKFPLTAVPDRAYVPNPDSKYFSGVKRPN